VGQPFRGQRNNHLIETGQPPLPFRDDLRLETRIPVPRHSDLHRPRLSEHGLGPVAITGITAITAGRVVPAIAEMVIQLAFQRALDYHFRELAEQAALAGEPQAARAGTLGQLPQHLLISRRQLRWQAETTTDADRKQLLRHLIEEVAVTVTGDSEQVDVGVTWAGGHRTAGRVVRPVAALAQLSYLPRLRQRAGELLAAGCTGAQIADALNAEGLRPPKRASVFTKNAVHDLLSALGLNHPRNPSRRPALGEDEWWLRDLADHLGMPKITLDAWVRRGWADGYLHPEERLIVVRAGPAETERLRTLRQTPRGQHMRRPWQQNQEASTSSETEGNPDNDNRTSLCKQSGFAPSSSPGLR